MSVRFSAAKFVVIYKNLRYIFVLVRVNSRALQGAILKFFIALYVL